MMRRGLIPQDVFDVIEREKKKRGSFHLEALDDVKKYCGYELHTLCVFMHMLRDACWTADEIRLKSFHSPAAIASVLLERINVRGHSWPVKSTSNMEYEQEIAHWSYFGGRFEWILKGWYNKATGYQIDLASAYPYAMQFLPSMLGGHWEKLKDFRQLHPFDLSSAVQFLRRCVFLSATISLAEWNHSLSAHRLGILHEGRFVECD
jgi:hypothetical protein